MLIMVMVLMLFMLHVRKLGLQAVLIHGLYDLDAAQPVPGGSDQPGMGVELLQKLRRSQGLFLSGGVAAAHNDQVGIFNLIVEKLAEVAHVHAALASVHHGDSGAHMSAFHLLHGPGHIGQLAHAGGLDYDPVRRIVLHDLLEGLGKVPHQGAADTAGVHLRYLHARVLQEAAVYGDLAELVLYQNQLLALIALGYELPDKRCLPRAQKARKNVYSRQAYYLQALFFTKRVLYHLSFIFTICSLFPPIK